MSSGEDPASSGEDPTSSSPPHGREFDVTSDRQQALSSDPRRVVMLVSSLRRYRVRFYELLRQHLAEVGVTLDLVYSTPRGSIGGRGDTVDLAWAHHVKEVRLSIGRYELTWQNALDIVSGADMVVVQQATKRLENYVFLVKQALGGPRVAFWGHGRNFQATSSFQARAEWLKSRLLGQAHWFFAYNDLSAEILDRSGYPRDRVTVVGNTIDTRSLAASRDRVTEADTDSLRSRLGLEGEHVGIYCGAMYPEKRLEFLVQAAQEIRSIAPDFELVVVGSGVDRHIVDEAAAEHEWLHSVGPLFGDDLARHFALARVFLMPGLVGLAVLDSFVLEVPLVTTADALHSPEIAYLEDGVNGVMVPGNGGDGSYATAVAEILTDDALHARLVEGCRSSARSYNVENMAEVFADGVVRALDKSRGVGRSRLSDR